MKVLVCGDRNYSDYDAVYAELSKLPADTEIIEGGAPGADFLAGVAAVKLGFKLTVVKARWDVLGRAAGPIRNSMMLDMKPDRVLAFHDDIQASRGTKDTILKAKQLGIQVRLVEKPR